MATFVATHPAHADARQSQREGQGATLRSALLFVSGLTLFAAAVGGYHPYAEDGGLYAAGIKLLLDPGLYPHGTGFVLAPMRHSLFAPGVAGLVRASHLPLPVVLLALHLGSIWGTLFAAWMLAKRCWQTREAQAGAVALLACWLSLPIAGTALFFMDPYLTARSISTPCMILALVGALELTRHRAGNPAPWHGVAIWAGSLCLAAAMHPLMAAYALAASITVIWIRLLRPRLRAWGLIASCAAALALAGLAQHLASPESAAYVGIAMTRSYWFLAEWRWYEVVGLAAPMAILAGFSVRAEAKSVNGPPRLSIDDGGAASALAQTGFAVGILAVVVSLVFARGGLPVHIVARMQPLRAFQAVYLMMVLALGATLGEKMLRRETWRWLAALLVLGGTMMTASRSAYPNSPHLELPAASSSVAPANPWVSAFLWIRENTPRDALFALDSDYIHAPKEDAHCFRAIAERSALADYSKDGGEAAIAPGLTEAWTREQAAQQQLNEKSDAERMAALKALGVDWVVLDAEARTAFACPYRNPVVKACRLADRVPLKRSAN